MPVTFRARGAAAAFLPVIILAVTVVACGVTRPRALDGSGGLSPGDDDDGYPELGSGGSAGGGGLDCDAGTRQGDVCGCLDLTLVGDAPNLYFVLDRSGSMNEGDKWTRVRTVVASLAARLGPRARFGAALVPGSDEVSCSPGAEVLPPRQGDAPAGTAGPTVSLLLTTTAVNAGGGTPMGATLRALTPRLTKLPGRTFVILATDGGPNCNADASCGVDRCTVNIESMTPNCQPGGDLNCCDPGQFGPANCLDDDETASAVEALAGAGIRTFVVGVPGSAPYATLLDRLADVGGTARAGAPRYYRVDTASEDALASALAAVAGQAIGTCELPLQNVPDPKRVNVYLDGTVVRQAGDDGWRLDRQTVVLLGETCRRVRTGEALSIRIVAGCETVIY